MTQWWKVLEPRARIGFIACAALLAATLVVAGWWLLRPQQAVLFSGLRPQDAALLAAELEKQKIPYELGEGGATLLVDQAQVHAVRLKVMGRDLPLHGGVGLELFNNADFGMTEFAQKINYQRALQGELTRTILSLAEIRDARVHLALPEQGLFKQASTRPKAAITLLLRPGRSLRREQVQGIQRLVAAAVPGLVAQEVTLVDEQGVALSRAGGEEGEGGSVRLDLKRETENYLSRKAGLVLERAFGPGQALASVDVTLNMDQVRVTTEDVVGAPDARGGATGVLVRERESARDSAATDARAPRGSSIQRDAEYQAGRRVEQVVSQPGSIRRLHVVALVRQPLPGEQQEQVRRLVAAAVGASVERGDSVVVQSFVAPEAQPSAAGPEPPAAVATATSSPEWLLPIAAVLLVSLALLALLRARRRSKPPQLSEAQRRLALRRVQAWLAEDAKAASTVSMPAAAKVNT